MHCIDAMFGSSCFLSSFPPSCWPLVVWGVLFLICHFIFANLTYPEFCPARCNFAFNLSGLAMVGPTPSQMMSNKMFCLILDVVFIKAVIGAFSFSSIVCSHIQYPMSTAICFRARRENLSPSPLI